MSLVNPETGEVVPALTEDEARSLTERIRETVESAWRLLLEAHERRAWTAMGYATWAQYVGDEFGMSRTHSYAVLDVGRVTRAIEEAAGVSCMQDITERDARVIKPHLHAVTDRIRRETAGQPPERVVNMVGRIIEDNRIVDPEVVAERLGTTVERAKALGPVPVVRLRFLESAREATPPAPAVDQSCPTCGGSGRLRKEQT